MSGDWFQVSFDQYLCKCTLYVYIGWMAGSSSDTGVLGHFAADFVSPQAMVYALLLLAHLSALHCPGDG